MENQANQNQENAKETFRSYEETIAAAYASGGDAEQTGASFSSLEDRVKELNKEVHKAEKFTVADLDAQDWEPGSQVFFGEKDGAPISWHVLEKQGQLRLILSDGIIAEAPYNKMYIDTYWGTCSLRRWLNQEFLQKHFSFQEKIRIVNTRITNRRNPKWESDGGPETIDKLFVLDMEELEKYFPNQEDRKIGKWWWLRNPGSGLLSVACVYEDGSIYDFGINNNYPDGGVRPAMWIRIRQ